MLTHTVFDKMTVKTLDGKKYTLLNEGDLVYLIEKYMGRDIANEVEEWIRLAEETSGEVVELERDIEKFEQEIEEYKEEIEDLKAGRN